MNCLNEQLKALILHLKSMGIIEQSEDIEANGKEFHENVLLLRDTLRERYPQTKLKRMMKSVHYANGFTDEDLKQSAFILDEVEQYLVLNGFLDHDESVEFFNDTITVEGFVITPVSLVETMLKSMMISKSCQ